LQITDDSDKTIPANVLKEKQGSKKLVKFLNAAKGEEFCWVDPQVDNVKLFSSDPSMLDNNSAALKEVRLKKAVKLAKEMCGIAVEETKKRKKASEVAEPQKKKVKAESETVSSPTLTPSSSSTSMNSTDSSDKVTLTDDELSNINQELAKCIEQNDTFAIRRYIQLIHDQCKDITVEQLKNIKIGKTVAGLRKHEDEEISSRAKFLVKHWTAIATPATSATPTTTAASTKPLIASPTKPIIKKVSTPAVTTPTPTKKIAPPTKIDTSSPKIVNNSVKTQKSPTTPLSATPTPSSTPTMALEGMPQCGDSKRDSWRMKIGQGLSKVMDAEESKVIDLAVAIETLVHKHSLTTPTPADSYTNQCRTLSRNLNASDNNDFRTNVYNGDVDINTLPTMNVKEMASKERQKERQILQVRKENESMTAKPVAVESSMFRCGKCKQKKCTFYEMQTRSADEPMTAFITCLNCGNRWKQ